MEGHSSRIRLPEPTTSRLSDFVLKDQLGEGSFGIVWGATDTRGDSDVVIKMLKNPDVTEEELVTEIGILDNLEPSCKALHVPCLREWFVDQAPGQGPEEPPHVYIVTNHVPGQSLDSLLDGNVIAQLPHEEQTLLVCNMIAAVADLHDKQVVHRDIKPANINVGDPDNPLAVSLLDFGLACVDGDCQGFEGIGTPGYMAPEIIREDPRLKYDFDTWKGVDLFALGMTLYEVVVGAPFFDQVWAVYEDIRDGEEKKIATTTTTVPSSPATTGQTQEEVFNDLLRGIAIENIRMGLRNQEEPDEEQEFYNMSRGVLLAPEPLPVEHYSGGKLDHFPVLRAVLKVLLNKDPALRHTPSLRQMQRFCHVAAAAAEQKRPVSYSPSTLASVRQLATAGGAGGAGGGGAAASRFAPLHAIEEEEPSDDNDSMMVVE